MDVEVARKPVLLESMHLLILNGLDVVFMCEADDSEDLVEGMQDHRVGCTIATEILTYKNTKVLNSQRNTHHEGDVGRRMRSRCARSSSESVR